MENREASWYDFWRILPAAALLGGGLLFYNNLDNRLETRNKSEGRLERPGIERVVKEVAIPNQVPRQIQETRQEIRVVTSQKQNQAKPQEKRNYKTTDFSTDSDEVLLARMLFGEARNCSDEEMIDVAYTAINRANDGKRWNGETLREAVLKPWQYSCFNKNDVNREKLMDPEKYDAKSWKRCLRIAKDILSGEYNGKNEGSTHYFAKNSRRPNWANSPQMIDIQELVDYKHDFYREN